MPAFWDASAVVRVCIPGQSSNRTKALLRETPPVIWWATPVEVRSAVERLRFERAISARAYAAARQRLDVLAGSWREVLPTDLVRELAQTQLESYRLRAADAFQLAAALVWARQKPRGRLFVSNDTRLTDAARRAGFDTAEA